MIANSRLSRGSLATTPVACLAFASVGSKSYALAERMQPERVSRSMLASEFAFDDLEFLMDRADVDLYVVGQTAIGLLDEFSIRLGLVGEIILRTLEVLSKIFVPPWACYKLLDRIGEEADLITHARERKDRIRHANLMERYGVHCGYDGIRDATVEVQGHRALRIFVL